MLYYCYYYTTVDNSLSGGETILPYDRILQETDIIRRSYIRGHYYRDRYILQNYTGDKIIEEYYHTSHVWFLMLLKPGYCWNYRRRSELYFQFKLSHISLSSWLDSKEVLNSQSLLINFAQPSRGSHSETQRNKFPHSSSCSLHIDRTLWNHFVEHWRFWVKLSSLGHGMGNSKL